MDSIGLYAQLACIWEASARKPGNVHRFRDFDDSAYTDFLLSAAAVAPVLQRASRRRVGETVLDGVRATRRVVKTNTNLGILLLLAPLAAVPLDTRLRDGVSSVLDNLDVADARAVYEAIRIAAPGALGRVQEQDVAAMPTLPLREVMMLAAERDLVARQYANNFEDVFEGGLEALARGLRETSCLEEVIVYCHLDLMARHADSLITRKRGPAVAEEARARAAHVLALAWPHEERSRAALADLDDWLRADGRGRNPGATADLVAACLFVALREGIMTLPPPLPWSAGEHHA